jgi:hypothetical protein
MESDTTSIMKRWGETWKAAEAEFSALRQRELREIDTQTALINLADAFESCRLNFTPSSTSGLVIQQAWFKLLRDGKKLPPDEHGFIGGAG